MELEVGSILEGKVTGITKFGAFVSFPGGKSGLVHISEIANAYVTDVRDHVEEGAAVTVKVIGIGKDGKINLSIKKAEEAPVRERAYAAKAAPYVADNSIAFEDKLKRFMQDSDSKIAGNRHYAERKSVGRRKR